METLQWRHIGIYSTILFIAARAPFKVFTFATLLRLTGHNSVLNGPPWNHPQSISILIFALLVFTLICARSRDLREVLLSMFIASAFMFPLTPMFLLFGFMAACIALSLIFVVSRLWIAYLYYRPLNTNAEQGADGKPPEALQPPH